MNFSSFLANFQFRAEVKKVEPSRKSFSSSYGSSQLGSDSSLQATVLQLCSCVFILELKILQMLGRRKCCLIFWILVDNSSSFFQGWIFVAMALIFGLLAKFCSCFWNIICCKPCKEAEANQVWERKNQNLPGKLSQ